MTGDAPIRGGQVIDRAICRVLAYLHVSFAGIFAFSSGMRVGEFDEMALLAAREVAEVARAHPDTVTGVKARIGRPASGLSGIMPWDVALDMANDPVLPPVGHIDEPPPSKVASRRRRGDIPFSDAPMQGDGTVRAEARAARERCVMFDLGHGQGSFTWKSARAIRAQGFAPDVIFPNIYALRTHGPAHGKLHKMTEFLALSWPSPDEIAAASPAPAHDLGRTDLGDLGVGAVGNISVFRAAPGDILREDVTGENRPCDQRLTSAGILRNGEWRAA